MEAKPRLTDGLTLEPAAEPLAALTGIGGDVPVSALQGVRPELIAKFHASARFRAMVMHLRCWAAAGSSLDDFRDATELSEAIILIDRMEAEARNEGREAP